MGCFDRSLDPAEGKGQYAYQLPCAATAALVSGGEGF
jgi:hypothetical protein